MRMFHCRHLVLYGLPAVLYGCETCTLTIREEHRLRVFENRVQKRKFGTIRDELVGSWGKLYNEELHKLIFSSNACNHQVKEHDMDRACSRHGKNI
jgi:hypothetical protein